MKRDPDNSLILLQQIIRRTREVRGGGEGGVPPPPAFRSFVSNVSVLRQALQECQYELVAPLATMFSSTLLQVQTTRCTGCSMTCCSSPKSEQTFVLHGCLQTPHCPPDSGLLPEAEELFRRFLTWPEPFSSVCRNLLTTLQLEQKAPGKCVCVLVYVVLFLAIGRPLVARLKHAVNV